MRALRGGTPSSGPCSPFCSLLAVKRLSPDHQPAILSAMLPSQPIWVSENGSGDDLMRYSEPQAIAYTLVEPHRMPVPTVARILSRSYAVSAV
jgi:hypothetical protein